MPWGVAAAAVVGAGASIYSSKKAAKASEKGADAAAQVQWDMYDQSRQDQAPWLGTGANALKQLAALNGVQYSASTDGSRYSDSQLVKQTGDSLEMDADLYASDPVYQRAWDRAAAIHQQQFGKGYRYDSNPDQLAQTIRQLMTQDPEYAQQSQSGGSGGASSPDYSAFYESPDYQFAFQEGNRATNAGLAARGLSNSGRAMKELTRYGQGMASQQLNTYRNALAAMAGVGQSAASNLGSMGANTANQVGGAMQNSADARASGYLATGNTINNTLGQAASLGAYGYGQGWWGNKGGTA